ncbi:thiamine pyrophosphate-binding protein [Haloplanus aerogenes]|uniref:Acetolactate synthase-1/2/3 large subunit n=1 Tax=Haloplanus aerogenes TaxID=660522 RepID=A0A3M0DHW3_9EURY|nr:thiamine pyrophosphate-binding protein [Haloplanus aerogenes]AZH26181.1 thiamine pyrophosphate-binding protein [Haloplanus aerogenes]RMB18366.1 acetolactate synthase-1/2/3 large subunit [Haloplanus aerogenes]
MSGGVSDDASKNGAEHVYDALVDAGVDLLVGLPGTQTLPLDRIVTQRDEIDYVMARHETAIPHIAWGHYESGGGMAATLTVPGPGDTNAMHGLKNAFEDCVPMVHISADVDPDDRGRGPIHEIAADTFDNVVKSNQNVGAKDRLDEQVSRGIAIARTPPTGPVRLGIPSSFLDSPVRPQDVRVDPERQSYDIDDEVEETVELLTTAERPVVYVGGGARRSDGGPDVASVLAAALDAPVVASYKGKGVVPEDNERFVGVTGSHLPAGAERILSRSDVVLALGTDFDGVTTDDWSLPMGDRLVHVNVDPADIGDPYPPTIPIVGDVGDVGKRLLAGIRARDQPRTRWDGAALGRRVREEYHEHLADLGVLAADAEPAYTPAVLRTIRERLPRETVVVTGVGGFRLWTKQVFEAYTPETYVTAGSWAGMGVGLPAALGAKLANPDTPVVSLIGDGGLLMCLQELHTAVEYDLDVIAVVFDNADYGIISKSAEFSQPGDRSPFRWDSPDFVTLAEGFGARGTAVSTATEAGDALEAALERTAGPELIDVQITRSEPSVVEAADYESTIALE